MTVHQALFPAYNNPLIVVDSADFDGVNDYMLRTATLTGAADGKSGLLSFWLRIDGTTTALRIFGNTSAGTLYFTVTRNATSGPVEIIGRNSAGTLILQIPTSSSFGTSATWRHFLSSWDLASGVGHMYVNDVSDIGTTTLTNDTINYDVGATYAWHIGANGTGNLKVDGCLAEFYFVMNQYLNLSLISNRRKFISASGKPVHLGTDGSLPLGIVPHVYQHLDDGEAVANFATNRTGNGNFTITGTLDTGSTSPSD